MKLKLNNFRTFFLRIYKLKLIVDRKLDISIMSEKLLNFCYSKAC